MKFFRKFEVFVEMDPQHEDEHTEATITDVLRTEATIDGLDIAVYDCGVHNENEAQEA